jgi:predicted signal transduction protein with EAL and GGDEF domain
VRPSGYGVASSGSDRYAQRTGIHLPQRDSGDALRRLETRLQRFSEELIAEGVESTDVWDLLETLGCDTAQGYYIRPPLAADAFADRVRSRDWEQQRRCVPLRLLS